MFDSGEKWYMVGIKGVGMTALVSILKNRGVHVDGSDVEEVFLTDEVLDDLGVNVDDFGTDLPNDVAGVIHSAAFGDDNPQIATAKSRGIPVLAYTEALGALSENYTAVGISGTHGKTTITAWLGFALKFAGADPTVVVGTMVPQFDNKNALAGNSELLVAETCEYRRHFLSFNPDLILITNIDMDHPDYFADIQDMRNAYKEYVAKLPLADGAVILHESTVNYIGDDNIPETKISYGVSDENDWRLLERAQEENIQKIRISSHNLNEESTLEISMPGEHNAMNAVGILALGYELQKNCGFSWEKFLDGVERFQGTTRRMEFKGNIDGLMVFDDYAHHPAELVATLKTLRERFPDYYIVANFMPHTFSRTEELFDEFAEAFGDADEVMIMPIYSSAREKGNAEELAKSLADAINKYHNHASLQNPSQKAGQNFANFFGTFGDVADYMKPLAKENTNTILITLGAGDNWKIIDELKV